MKFTRRWNVAAVVLLAGMLTLWAFGSLTGVFTGLFGETTPTVTRPSKTENWSWYQFVENVDFVTFDMNWNGGVVVTALRPPPATAAQGANRPPSDVIDGVNTSFIKTVANWAAGGPVKHLYLNGTGRSLVVETTSGELLAYPEWQKTQKPLHLPFRGTVQPAPNGLFLLIGPVPETAGATEALNLITLEGQSVARYPAPGSGWLSLFPFAAHNQQVLLVSGEGEASLHDGSRELWRISLGAPATALGSAFLRGDRIFIATGGGDPALRVFSNTGKSLYSVPLSRPVNNLYCANESGHCALYFNDKGGQEVLLIGPAGKNRWRYGLDAQADKDGSVIIAENGGLLVGSFQEGKEWVIAAWGLDGQERFVLPVPEGLRKFSVSWDGKRIAAITGGQRFYFRKFGKPARKPNTFNKLKTIPREEGERLRAERRRQTESTKPAVKGN